jgi:hypothetical protein
MYFHFGSWLRRMRAQLSGKRPGSTFRHKDERRHGGLRLCLEALEPRVNPVTASFAPGAYLIDMGQPTQTVGNALKPYGLVYDMVTNFKVPVNWAINPDKTTFRLDAGDATPVDFTATITTGTKNYSGGSFIIDEAFLTPSVVAAINSWKAQGVVVDTLAAPLTTEIYGQVTSFPLSVLDEQNGKLAIPYFVNAGVPDSAYHIGVPTDLDHCDDVFILRTPTRTTGRSCTMRPCVSSWSMAAACGPAATPSVSWRTCLSAPIS